MASERSMEVAEIGPAPPFQKSNPNVQYPPFPTLIGEHALLLSKTSEGNAMVTNFRFCVCERRSFINIPLMAIGELVVAEAYCFLKIGCKDGATYSVTFATVEDCQQCVSLLRERTGLPQSMKDLFAFRFYALTDYKSSFEGGLTAAEAEQITLCKPADKESEYTFGKEVSRQGFDTSKRKIWRISLANEDFEFCSTYPKFHIMPATIDDAELRRSLDFRAMKRFPSVVWRDKDIGVVLIRSSQPMSSFLGLSYFSNQADVSLLEKIVEACHKESEAIVEDRKKLSVRALMPANAPDRSPGGDEDGAQGSLVTVDQAAAAANGGGHGASNGSQHTPPSANSALPTAGTGDIGKLAIVDCRSIAGIWGNSLKGGGTEDEVVYKCTIIHLDLANIHTVRDSFNKLRATCNDYPVGTYLKSLSGSMWLTYIAALLRGANIVVDLLQNKHRPVLVHCSDGWDRTSQICSLSQIMMDKYYRTLQGFQVLVEREWLHFGHKFGERGGHDPHCSDTNQMSPIFLQFLDCVHQLCVQNPAAFQFNEAYLVKLLKHSQACLFGTFLHNCERERAGSEPTASVWTLLKGDNSQFVNLLYKPHHKVKALKANYEEHAIVLWKNVYMAGHLPGLHGSQTDFHMDSSLLGSGGDDAGNTGDAVHRSKSMDDLSKANAGSGRRNSDPSVTPNPQESSAAAAPTVDSHDTSSSSAEILHYPEDSPNAGKGNNSSHSEGDNDGAVGGGKAEATAAADAALIDVPPPATDGDDGSVEKAGEISSSESPPPLDASSINKDAAPVERASDSDNSPASIDNHDVDPGLSGVDSDNKNAQFSKEGEEGPRAQNLTPSSSSVFSEVEECSLSTSEHTLCHTGDNTSDLDIGGGDPARLPTVTTAAVVAGTVTAVTNSTGTDIPAAQANQLSSSSSPSPSSSSIVLASASASLAPDPENDNVSVPPGEGSVHQGCQVGADLVVTPCSAPVSTLPHPLSSSSSSSTTSLPQATVHNGRLRSSASYCTSSLLSERLAKSGETSPTQQQHPTANGTSPHKSDCSNGKLSSHSPVNSHPNSADNHSQHSRQQRGGGVGEENINDITARLKAGALLDASRKPCSAGAVNGSSHAAPLNATNGASKSSTASSLPRPVYQNGVRSSPPTAISRTTNKPQGCHQQVNGAGEDDSLSTQRSMTDSTDTLVDHPGTDVPTGQRKHSKSGSSVKHLTRTSTNGAAGVLGSASVSPCSSYSSPSLLTTTASPQRRDSRGCQMLAECADSPQFVKQSRRARAASGASRDLSVSPCSAGAWADTGRLRNPSGGGELVARRWIGATVATSTSDISDSFVGKVGNHNTVAMMERGQSVRQHMDVDGLTMFCDERQDLLGELVAEKDRKIAELEGRLRQAIDIIRANREQQQQQQHQYAPSSSHLNGHTNFLEELLMTETDGAELSSLGTVSNAASDSSWEAIDESEERIIKWMPDSMVTHCAGCDGEFWVAKRKHHCRNCGKVFCWDCSNYMAPVPHQHLNKPQRVCRRCHSLLLQLSPGASSDGRIPTLVADG